MNDQALWGLHLFRTKARCINCHNSPLLSDNQFHNTGLNYIGRDKEDLGRGGVTGLRADLGKFRTPTLRDLLYTGDYMHSGDMPLDEDGAGVIEFYNNGGNLVEAVGVEKYTQPKPSPLLAAGPQRRGKAGIACLPASVVRPAATAAGQRGRVVPSLRNAHAQPWPGIAAGPRFPESTGANAVYGLSQNIAP